MDDIRCPYCRREVAVGDLNMEQLVGRCLGCSKLFDLRETEAFAQRERSGGPGQNPTRPRAAQPKAVRLVESMRGHELRIRWFGPQHLFLAFFCVFWDGFLVLWYSALLTSKGGVEIVAALFPLLHVAAGVFLTYTCLAGFLNTTTIELADGRLRMTHAPLPWKGNLDMDASDIKQLFVVENIGSKGSRSYELCALLKNQTRISFLSQPLDVLRFVEQHLESLLKIEDARVLGEFAG